MDDQATPSRILLTDDDTDLLSVMGSLLKKTGFNVELAHDGMECLAKAETFAPDLIVLDIMMPGIHGLETLKRLKANPKTSQIKVIMCSAKNFKTDQGMAIQLGALAVLAKPINNRDFVDAIRGGLKPAETSQGAAARAEAAPREVFEPRVRIGLANARFWGTRGSVPVSGPNYIRHGGNTSCLSIVSGGELVILDAGTGIRELGDALATKGPRRIHLFITHTHWDHIQGFPFFRPAYLPGFEIQVYGASGFGKDLASVFRGQLDQDYFPVQLEDMRAKIEIQHLDKPVRVGDMTVTWEYTHHPGASVAYQVETNGRRLVYLSDNEFLRGYHGPPHHAESQKELLRPYQGILSFVSGADLLVAESQYSNEDYRDKVDWGHSSTSNACLLTKLSGVKRWLVTHHDPYYSDEALHKKIILTRQTLASLGHVGEVDHAFDGMVEYF